MTGNEPQIFRNPARRPIATRPAPAGAPTAFHRRWPGYAPTRLVDAPGLASQLGLTSVVVKDEAGRFGLPAFKILGASWAVYRLLSSRLGAEPKWSDLTELRAALAPLGPLTLVAATDGNHGRAVAHMAARLGLSARIFVPRGTAVARITGIESEGAIVTVIDGPYEDAVAVAAALASDDTLVVSDTSWEGYTEVPRTVIEGYDTIFTEVDAVAAHRPDLVVVPMGVGALAAAVVEHYGATATIVAVEPFAANCGLRSAEAGRPVLVPGPHDSIMAGLNCGTVSIVAWPILQAGVDVFVAISDAAAARRCATSRRSVSSPARRGRVAGRAARGDRGGRH